MEGEAKHDGKQRNKSHKRSTSVLQIPDLNDEDYYKRDRWFIKLEFLLSMIGYSVGIGNIWRFPYVAYKNGGGAFLIPYLILLFFVGMPMLYMEAALGQYARLSPLQVWRCAPLSTGVGVGAIVISLLKAIYISVMMSYSVIYFGASMRGIGDEVPWSYCGSWWGSTDNCVSRSQITEDQRLALNSTRCTATITSDCTDLKYSSEEFWDIYVLAIGPGLEKPGDLHGWKYDLPLALLLAWVFVFLICIRGVRSSGKAAYVTTLVPYCVLTALLVRALTLDGAAEGLLFLVQPQWEKLLDPMVWKLAAEEMILGLGVTWGAFIMFGSYNRFHNKVQVDSVIVTIVHFLTYILSCCAVFSLLGWHSVTKGVSMKSLADNGELYDFGLRLAFIGFPETLGVLPLAWLWSGLYFFMLFVLGLNAVTGLVQTVLTASYDAILKLRFHKAKVSLAFCISMFLLSLSFVSFNGSYIVQLVESYGIRLTVVFLALWEMVSVMWIYGYKNFSKDISLMLNSQPWWFWKICWAVVCPLVLLAIFISMLVFWEHPSHVNQASFPGWVHLVGWILVGLSAAQVPLWALIMSLVYCMRRKVFGVFKPAISWGPGDPKVRKSILREESGMVPSRGEYVESAPHY